MRSFSELPYHSNILKSITATNVSFAYFFTTRSYPFLTSAKTSEEHLLKAAQSNDWQIEDTLVNMSRFKSLARMKGGEVIYLNFAENDLSFKKEYPDGNYISGRFSRSNNIVTILVISQTSPN